MSDKIKEHKQYQFLKRKYPGIGHESTTSQEFISTIKKDSYNSIVQHKPLLYYTSLASGENMELQRIKILKKLGQL